MFENNQALTNHRDVSDKEKRSYAEFEAENSRFRSRPVLTGYASG